MNTILASFDPVAVDAVAGRLIGHDPGNIKYLVCANGLLGDMNDIKIRQ